MDALGKLSEKAGGLTEGAYKVIWLAFFGCIFVVRIKKFIVKCWDTTKSFKEVIKFQHNEDKIPGLLLYLHTI